uniref:Uncharacterized protein n=1 Tax=Myoviridae sp. ctsip2 TaxID=2826705 RepID=A0A8S5N5Z5_9CAUD|nr:MAG TPA: hypothetical protein [Myoviridae sp. ctsip2]
MIIYPRKAFLHNLHYENHAKRYKGLQNTDSDDIFADIIQG